jgi:dihydrofolate synthase / folylpolyglutamate synthase
VRVAGESPLALRSRGAFQRRNFALAEVAAGAFLGELDPGAVGRAASEVEVPGRLELVASDPLVIHDGAHNPDGAAALAEALPEVSGGRPLTAVMSVLDDKDAAGMLAELLPLCDRIVFTRSSHPRALSPATLQALAGKLGRGDAELEPNPWRALECAREAAGPGGAVLATGSIYLIADLARGRLAAGERVSTM